MIVDENLMTYRIFRTFKKAMMEDPAFKKRVLSLAKPSHSTEKIVTNSTLCIVDKEWVEYIEQKLPFLVNAVAEERQFVRSEGEVLPIDRVRNISKESIEDLGKHSNYLTHDPAETGGKVIPDRLLVAKKENDYKVYENRFLYTCLVYLNQFVEMRLNEIVAVTGRYSGYSKYEKKIASQTSSLDIVIELTEKRLNDPIAGNRGGSAEAVRKISGFLATTRMLLGTPLMKDVSTAPLVKPPITKTNIIRFDPNFRETLELYHFLHSYDKKGYEIKEVENTLSPFKGRNKEDFALLLFLDSYLTYVYGSDIATELHLKSEDFEKAEKEAAVKAIADNLAKAKREMDEHKGGAEAYVALLEESEKLLEKALSAKEDEIAELEKSYREEAKRLSRIFDEGIVDYQADLGHALVEKDAEMAKVREEADRRIKEAQELADKKMEEARALVQAKEEEKQAVLADMAALKAKMESEAEAHSIRDAEFIALKARSGEKEFEAMTSKEKFAYLDAQKKAFDAYYKKQWAMTKKAIFAEAMAAEDPKSRAAKKRRKAEEAEAKKAEAEKTVEPAPTPEPTAEKAKDIVSEEPKAEAAPEAKQPEKGEE